MGDRQIKWLNLFEEELYSYLVTALPKLDRPSGDARKAPPAERFSSVAKAMADKRELPLRVAPSTLLSDLLSESSAVVTSRLLAVPSLVRFIMDFVFRLMAPVGVSILLFIVPLLTTITLILAAVTGKIMGFLLQVGCLCTYMLWASIGFLLIFKTPVGNLPWYIPVFAIWQLIGCIFHVFIISKMKIRQTAVFWLNILCLIINITAVIGIEFVFYSARFV